MNWREKLICRILLVIVKMIAPGNIADDVKNLANHISCLPQLEEEKNG